MAVRSHIGLSELGLELWNWYSSQCPPRIHIKVMALIIIDKHLVIRVRMVITGKKGNVLFNDVLNQN